MRLPVGVGTMHLAAEFEHLRFAAFANRGNQLSGRILDMHGRRFSERERPHLLVGVPGGEYLGGQRVVAGGGAADKVRQGHELASLSGHNDVLLCLGGLWRPGGRQSGGRPARSSRACTISG